MLEMAAFLEKGGAEPDVTAADLGRGEAEAAVGGVEAARVEAVGLAIARLDKFVRAGTDVLGAFMSSSAILGRPSPRPSGRRRLMSSWWVVGIA